MYERIAQKIERHQFLSRSEFTALAEMLAKIRQALTRIDCWKLREIESYYYDLMIRASASRRRFASTLPLKTELIISNQFCYDADGFGYFKFQ